MNRLAVVFGFRSAGLLWVALLGFSGTACKSSSGYPIRDAAATPAMKVKGDGGSLQITANFNSCPLVAFDLSPPDGKVGEQLELRALASDPDPGDQVSYAWTVGGGSFGDPKAASTTYTCSPTAGPQTIVLSVSDGQCTVTSKISTTCFATGIQLGTGGAAAGMGGMGGGRQGQGFGGASGTGATGTTGTGGTGAGGRSGSGGTQGQGGATTGGSGPACAGDPTHDEGSACETCTADNCFPGTDSCEGMAPVSEPLSDALHQACLNLYCCIRASKCAVKGDPIKCWCGTNAATCLTYPTGPMAANGPCANDFRAAAGTTDPATIKLRFVDPGFAIGRAVNLASCRGNFCGANAEPGEGIQPGLCDMP